MSEIPDNYKFSKTHEWVQDMDDGTYTVGISDYAQEMLGDIVFIELPEVGSNINAGDECAVVESVKAASDVYCPISGEITDSNSDLVDGPELLNKDPYGEAWLFRVKPADENDIDELMTADQYVDLLESKNKDAGK